MGPTASIPSVYHLGLLTLDPLPDPTLAGGEINDTLVIDHYRSSALTYAGKQRMGIRESFPDTSEPVNFIRRAGSAPVPLNEPVPLPGDFRDAIRLTVSNSYVAIGEFRAKQLGHLELLASLSSQQTDPWYSFTPDSIRPATGKLHVALCVHLADFLGISATAWFTQFVFGFPLTGALSQRFTFPVDTKINARPVGPSSLFQDKASRFISRARRAPVRHADALWADAMAQVGDGWITDPRVLDSQGNFEAEPDTPIINAYRFGVPQDSKLRGCDDLKDSRTNTACVVQTPISLCSWGHIAESIHLSRHLDHEWAFGKIDIRSAYKFLPIASKDSPLAVVTLWCPCRERRFGFATRTQLFGSTASALHYKCFSHILTTFLTRILLTPTFGYFGDFGFLTPADSASSALKFVVKFCDILGISLKAEKSDAGYRDYFSWAVGAFSRSH